MLLSVKILQGKIIFETNYKCSYQKVIYAPGCRALEELYNNKEKGGYRLLYWLEMEELSLNIIALHEYYNTSKIC